MELAHEHIVIIGAGLAGLTAAYRLEKLTGQTASIYEARHRPGGRVETLYLEDGSFEELGAKFITDGANPEWISLLIQEMGLETVSHSVSLKDRAYLLEGQAGPYYESFRGTPLPTEELYQQLKNTPAKHLGQLLDICLGEKTLSRQITEEFLRSYEGRNSQELSDTLLYSFWNFYQECHAALQNKNPTYHEDFIKGGNGQLVNRLAQREIVYGAPLKKIARQNGNGFILSFPHRTVLADYVILAMPCSALRNVIWEAEILPSDQWKAIQTFQYGLNDKILVPISLKGTIKPQFWVIDGKLIWLNQEATLLTFYYVADGEPFDPIEAIEKLKTFFPSLASLQVRAEPKEVLWSKDPYSLGSFSSWAPGQFSFFNEKSQFLEETFRSVFRPVDNRLFFAGEHTSNENRATMEGAVESGERAARMVAKIQKAL